MVAMSDSFRARWERERERREIEELERFAALLLALWAGGYGRP
jgi:hypothetical protein